MKLETFELERVQSLFENLVEYNLTETGVHPFSLSELLAPEQMAELTSIRLGYGWTNGDPALRRRVGALYVECEPGEVLVVNGVAEANLLACLSLLLPGDEMVLMYPNYMQIHGLARSLGVRIKPFFLNPQANWSPNMDELESLITPGVRMVALCNPNNPTGAVLGREEMDLIVNMARTAGAWIYADEVYRGAEISDEETPSFLGLTGYERIVVAGGLSKAYGLPGLRLGWLAGPEEFIAKAWSCRDYTTICCGLLSQYLAEKVLQPEMRLQVRERNRRIIQENLSLLSGWVNASGGLLSMIPPKAGAMAFIRYSFPMKSRLLAERLRDNKSVFVVDGECFGMDGWIRIGFGMEKEYLSAGLNRISDFLGDLDLRERT